jgi:two-component sensor histidine kinase
MNASTHREINKLPDEIKEYYRSLQLKLATHVAYTVLVIFSTLSVAFYFDSFEAFIPMFSGMIMGVIALIFALKGNFIIPFYLFSVGGVLIAGISLIMLPHNTHFSDALWMVAAVALAFFGINRTVGVVLLICSMVMIAIYFLYSLNIQIRLSKPLDFFQQLILYIELLSAVATNFYIFFMFYQLNLFSKQKLQDTYDNLIIQNKRISNQSRENTVLLKEVHHRVKNNLQMVISLLRMQSDEFEDEHVKIYFQSAINRIMSMSLVHQKLYQNEHISMVNIETYLTDLVEETSREYNFGKQKTAFVIQSDVEELGLRGVIVIGLIVNELITEILKHVTDETIDPTIHIKITLLDDDCIKLVVSENINLSKQNIELNSFSYLLIDALLNRVGGIRNVDKTPLKNTHHITLNSGRLAED